MNKGKQIFLILNFNKNLEGTICYMNRFNGL